jgi:transposase-like protein
VRDPLKGEEFSGGRVTQKFNQDFRDGAVRIVRETVKPIAQVARELGVNESTRSNWVALDRQGGGLAWSPSWRWSVRHRTARPHGFQI